MKTTHSIPKVAVAVAMAVSTFLARGQEPPVSLEERVRALEEQLAEQDDSAMHATWKNGLRLETSDGSIQFKVGGRIHYDVSSLSADSELDAAKGPFDDGTEFRRTRLAISGVFQDEVDFKMQTDFAGGDADFKDVWIGTHHALPVGKLKLGQFKEPFGLEELTSSNDIMFAERSLTSTFVPGRGTGAMLSGTLADTMGTWAVGLFRDSNSFGDQAGDGDNNVTARLTRLLDWKDDGEHVVHLGLALSTRRPNNDSVRYKSKPEAHMAPTLVDTAAFGSDRVLLVGLEGALVNGPWSVQTEYVRSSADRNGGDDVDLSSWYVAGSYFLTGEHRPYKRKKGSFGRVHPLRDWSAREGGGAWELAARYSTVDLQDSGLAGGELSDLTVGLNWYLNANTRVVLDWVRADLQGSGDANAVVARVQVAF